MEDTWPHELLVLSLPCINKDFIIWTLERKGLGTYRQQMKESIFTAMKTRRSLDVSKQAPKKRKQPKRLSLDPSNLQKSKDEEKENYGEGQPWKENDKAQRNDSSQSKEVGKPRRRRKREEGKGFEELYSSLQTNNRALATALEEARVEINTVNQENIYLKRQLHCERQFYVERIGKEVEQKVKCQFKAVEDCLQQIICKLLESSKLISSAVDMVSMPTNSANFTPVSCPIPMHSCDTTPPPDEPDHMEVTTADLVPMETTTTELGNIVITNLSKEMDLDFTYLQDTNHNPESEFTAQVPNSEEEDFSNRTDDIIEASDDSQQESSLEKPLRSKRRSSINVSYVMPSLRSKLRRGDPFTDPFFQGAFCYTKSKRKGRMSTGCIQKKPRHALANLTNVIAEEQESEKCLTPGSFATD